MPWEITHAIEETPYRCICGGGVAPFIRTDVAFPGGGHYHLCFGRCGRYFALALGLVMPDDLEAMKGRLADATEQLTALTATRERVEALETELANRDAELALARSGEQSALAKVAELERDIEDDSYGRFRRSNVAQALAEFRDDVVTGAAAGADDLDPEPDPDEQVEATGPRRRRRAAA